MKNLYLDLDDVLADFRGGFREKYQQEPSWDPKAMPVDWALDLFPRLNPVKDIALAQQVVEEYRPHFRDVFVLTAAPPGDHDLFTYEKVTWVRQHCRWLHEATVIVTRGAAGKVKYAEPGDVLIDDYKVNTEAWTAAGGFSLLHRNWEETKKGLEAWLRN